MSRRVLLATFAHEDDVLSAARTVRERGLRVIDAYTPYAVHGLDRALGLRPSRLTWVCFVCGILGAVTMLWFEHQAASVWWPINVGGKPWNSLPSDVPVAFEAAVLLAGFGSVFAFFAISRLYPGKSRFHRFPRTTDDRFVLVIDETDAAFDEHFVRWTLANCSAVTIEEHAVAEGEWA